MTDYTEAIAKLAREVAVTYGTPILVFRGAVMGAEVFDGGVTATSFHGYVGSGTFLLVGNEICSVRVVREPRVFRNKVRDGGLLEIVGCSELA